MKIAFELNDVQSEALNKVLKDYPDKTMTPEKLAKGVLLEWIIQNEAQLRAAELRK
jgi:ABC-type uncharacterized transport system YnjBCD substrate-binding protein